MKYVKRAIIIVGALLLLLTGAVYLLITHYKTELVNQLSFNLKDSYGVSLNVKDIDVSFFDTWPEASVKLKSVVVLSELFPDTTQPFIRAESVSLSLHLPKLIKKQFEIRSVKIKGAHVTMLKTKNGERNFEFKKTQSASSTPTGFQLDIRRVLIEDSKFSFKNEERHVKIGFEVSKTTIHTKTFSDGISAELKGDAFINGFLFKPEKGPFVSNTKAKLDLCVNYCFPRKELMVYQPSDVEIENAHYKVSVLAALGEQKKLVLNFKNPQARFDKVLKLLNTKMQKSLAQFTINKPLNADAALLINPGQREEPLVLVHFSTANNNVTIGNSKVPYTNISFKGLILSVDSGRTKGDAERAMVLIKNVKGNVQDVPFTAKVAIRNFTDPRIKIAADLNIDAHKVSSKPGKDLVLNGTAAAHINYSGSVKYLNKKQFLSDSMKLSGTLTLNNLSYREYNKPYTYKLRGRAFISNHYLKFDNLLLDMNGGHIKLGGQVNEFVQYVFGMNNGFKTQLAATTDVFDLNPYLDKSETAASSKMAGSKIEKNMHDADEAHFEFQVKFNAGKFLVRKVIAENAAFDLSYKNRLLTINSVKLNTCDGLLTLNGTIDNLHTIKADISAESINISKLFKQFENFGQTAIEDKNLKGIATVKAKFETELNDKMEIEPGTMKGQVKLKLQEGHLLDYEPLQNISNYIFRNRDFQDISFTEINETFSVRGYTMKIEELEIGSNVLNLFVSGVYDFKDKSTINLVIPWSNLKKRGKDYVPKQSGMAASDAKGLKLNYSGYPKNLKLSLGHKPLD